MTAGEDPARAGGQAATLHEIGERGLIERIRRRLGTSPGAGVLVGIGDDAAAVVAVCGQTLLLTTDALLEGVHFRRETATCREIGAKALTVNVSDIAAMGGEPRWALLTLALPPAFTTAEVDDLYAGFGEIAERFGVSLIGGDTCAAPAGLVLAVTLVGTVDGAPVRRSGARPGDLVLTTGTLGGSAAGLAVIKERGAQAPPEALDAVRHAHVAPTPRLAEGRLIRASGTATAMIDVSDGLVTDLGHLLAESGVSAEVRLADLPIAEATRVVARALNVDPVSWALSGGEDYELLFTVPAGLAEALARRVTAETGTPVQVIGRIHHAGPGLVILDEMGRPGVARPGFDHFA